MPGTTGSKNGVFQMILASDRSMRDKSLTPHDTSAEPAARLVAASKIYGEGDAAVAAIDAINLDFAPGQFTAVMGPSGSGKSTLMHCLAGLDQLTTGAAIIGDTNLTEMDDQALTLLRRTQIGFIFQAFNLIPSLTAHENIVLPLSLSGRRPSDELFDQVIDVLGIGDRLGHRPTELSGGQQQRVAVARALIAEPAIVFADEPTGALDTKSGAEILGFLRRAIDDRGQTTIMVTHDPSAAAWADRVVFIVDGHVHGELDNPTADSVLDVMRELH